MSSERTPPNLGTLILLTAMSLLTLNMFLPALPDIAQDLGAGESVAALAISGYMLVAGIFQLIIGPLSDRVGRRPVLLVSMAIYVAASAICAMAPNIEVFLVFRLVQGIVVAGSILAMVVIRDLLPAEQAAARMGTVAAAMAVAPMLAPVIGGLLDEWLGWRAIFVLYTVLGLVALVLAWWDMGETHSQEARGSRSEDYVALMKSKRFWAYTLCMTFAVGAFYVFSAGVPFVAGKVFGLNSAQVGVGLGSITLGFMLGAAVTSRFAVRVGLDQMIFLGRVFALFGVCLGLGLFASGGSHPVMLFGTTIFVGFGNGLTMANAHARALSVRPALAGTAAGLSGAFLVLGGAVLTWIAGLVVDVDPSPERLLSLLLACVGTSLVFALYAARE